MFDKKRPETSVDAFGRKHGILPYVLAGMAVGLALLTIGTAGLVAYDRATNPVWQQPAADAAGDVSADYADVVGEEAGPSGEDEASAAGTEAAPAEKPAPQESHYFECEYFYVDVPESWQQGTNVEQTDAGEWNFSHPEGNYVNQTIVTTSSDPMSGPNYHWLIGTTSDGTELWANDAATGFFGDGKATITLK